MRYLKSKKNSEKGFTLIETLIAGIILVLAICASTAIISRGSLMNKNDMFRRIAYQEMESILEQERLSYKQYSDLLNNEIGISRDQATINLPQIKLTQNGNIMGNCQMLLEKQLYTSGDGVQIPGIMITITVRNSVDNELIGKLSTVVTNVPLN